MHENDKYPGVPERIQLMDENGTVHEHPTYSRYIEDVNADTLREAYRLMQYELRPDVGILLIGRAGLVDHKMQDAAADLKKLARRAKILIPAGHAPHREGHS